METWGRQNGSIMVGGVVAVYADKIIRKKAPENRYS